MNTTTCRWFSGLLALLLAGGALAQDAKQPLDFAFSKVGTWDVVVYDMAIPAGMNSHVRAHWVQDFLRTIRVREKDR